MSRLELTESIDLDMPVTTTYLASSPSKATSSDDDDNSRQKPPSRPGSFTVQARKLLVQGPILTSSAAMQGAQAEGDAMSSPLQSSPIPGEMYSYVTTPLTSTIRAGWKSMPSPPCVLPAAMTDAGPHGHENQRSVTRSHNAVSLAPRVYVPITHAVSKAKNRERVHACEFPGCNKV